MPHKSKHHMPHRKERKPEAPAAVSAPAAGSASPAVQQASSVPPVKLVYRPSVPRTRAGAPVNMAALGATRYPFLTAELKWIGIFSLIILILLVVASLIVPRFF